MKATDRSWVWSLILLIFLASLAFSMGCAPKAGLRFRKFDGSTIPVQGAAILDMEGRVIDKLIPAPPGTTIEPGTSLYLALKFTYPKVGAPAAPPLVLPSGGALAQSVETLKE